ncbi:hypothetical protein ACFOG5_21945 [Pedobacter fastidiosus]|uniref:Uncharacterized protein n=1 Tax=Pedobacter fastidiosus TaxID=2765361 RepID=A0ABR7KND9_9SPHI|nr:hypothetical protein [Pedobacter fastidiosus]MBC6109594.1 hypothetical protein [Pedobacter fastidiosus]
MKKLLFIAMMCLMSVGAFANNFMVIVGNTENSFFLCRATIMQYDSSGKHICSYVAYGDTCSEAMASARELQAECQE